MKKSFASHMLVGVVLVCIGCASTAPSKSYTEEESTAISARVNSEIERQRDIKEKRKILTQRRVDESLIKAPIDVINFNYKKYFGNEHYKKNEYETQSEYIQRLQSLDDADIFHYFELDAELSYDADSQYYRILLPKVIETPVQFMKSVREHEKNINPSLARFETGQSRGQFLSVPLKTEEEFSTYTGMNAYGVKAEVIKYSVTSWEIAAIYDEFNEMPDYGYEMFFRKCNSTFSDSLVLKVPREEAMNLDLNKAGVIARIGVRFVYGIGPLALGRDFDSHSPTITEPRELFRETKYLAADLESICLLRSENREILSCRVRLY